MWLILEETVAEMCSALGAQVGRLGTVSGFNAMHLNVACCVLRKSGSFSPLYREVFILALVSFMVLKT